MRNSFFVNDVVVGENFQTEALRNSLTVFQQFRLDIHLMSRRMMNGFEPVISGELNLPVLVSDNHDADRVPRKVSFNNRRLFRAPPAAEPQFILAAVPVAPLGNPLGFGRLVSSRRCITTSRFREHRVLQCSHEARKFESTVHHCRRVRKTWPSP